MLRNFFGWTCAHEGFGGNSSSELGTDEEDATSPSYDLVSLWTSGALG